MPTSIHKAFHILEVLASSEKPLSLGEIATGCAVSKPSAVRLLQTLHDLGYVERPLGSRNYSLGGRVRTLLAADPHRLLRETARPWLLSLNKKFNETVNLGVLSAEKIRYIDYVETSQPLRMIVVPGFNDCWEQTAVGQAVVAAMPPSNREEFLTRSKFVRAAPKKKEERLLTMRQKLKTFAELGYAWEMEGAVEGVGCVAVALSALGFSQAAISISVPILRLGEDRKKAMVSELLKITHPKSIRPMGSSPAQAHG